MHVPRGRSNRHIPSVATETLLETTDGVLRPPTEVGGSEHPFILFSRGGSLLPSIYADARYIDAVVLSKAGGGSQNHIMLGGFDAWILSSIGGLDSVVNGTAGSAGWRNVIARVAPAAIAVVKHASYVKHTRFGPVGISWKYDAGTFSTTLSVPTGVTVAVHTPSHLAGADGRSRTLRLHSLKEGGVQLLNGKPNALKGSNAGVLKVSAHDQTSDGESESAIVTDVSSGVFHFEALYH